MHDIVFFCVLIKLESYMGLNFSISPPPKDHENSNSASSDNMEYGDLEMNLEFDCR